MKAANSIPHPRITKCAKDESRANASVWASDTVTRQNTESTGVRGGRTVGSQARADDTRNTRAFVVRLAALYVTEDARLMRQPAPHEVGGGTVARNIGETSGGAMIYAGNQWHCLPGNCFLMGRSLPDRGGLVRTCPSDMKGSH